MGITVQDDTGTVVGANAYIDVAAFKAYHDDRGNVYAPATDPQIAQAIIRATDYLDSRFRFRGIMLVQGQTTQWPRQAGLSIFIPWQDVTFGTPDTEFDGPTSMVALTDLSNNPIIGVPLAVKNATAEYALRALSQPLFQDAPAAVGGRLIQEHEVQVDTIREHTVYAPSQGTGQFQMPAYPAADMMLARAGLIETGRTVYR